MPRNFQIVRRKPYRRYRRRYKKRFNKYRKYFGKKLKISRPLGVPNYMLVKLKINRSFTLSGGGGAGGVLALYFITNSAFDPFGTAGASQPKYFDQYSLLYNSYMVTFAKMKFTFTNLSDTIYARVAAFESARAFTYASIDEAQSENGATSFTLEPAGCTHSQKIFTRKVNMKKKFGIPRLTPDEYGAVYTSNPTNMMYHHTVIRDRALTDNVTVACECNMIQYIRFYSKQLVADA